MSRFLLGFLPYCFIGLAYAQSLPMHAPSSGRTTTLDCGGTTFVETWITGDSLIHESLFGRIAYPANYALDKAIESCEDEHRDALPNFQLEVLEKAQRCESTPGCVAIVEAFDNVDCQDRSHGYSYCQTYDGDFNCYRAEDGELVEEYETKDECKQKIYQVHTERYHRKLRVAFGEHGGSWEDEKTYRGACIAGVEGGNLFSRIRCVNAEVELSAKESE